MALEHLSGQPDRVATNRLAPVNLSNLAEYDRAALDPPYVIDPIVPRDFVTLLGGHGGVGKSLLGLTISAHCACGLEWAGFKVSQCRSVYVSLEDPGYEVKRRLRQIIDVCGLDPSAVAQNLLIMDGTDCDGTLVTESRLRDGNALEETEVFAEMRSAVVGAGLIIIDNSSDAFGGDENRRREVREFIRRLSRLARDNRAGVILLAHLDKLGARNGTNGNSYSGSTAWHNGPRSRLALIAEDDRVFLHHEKSNLGKRADSVQFGWQDGVLLPKNSIQEQADRQRSLQEDADAVLKVIQVAIGAGATVPLAHSGPNTTASVLADYPELSDKYRGKGGRKKVRAAVAQLLRERRIVEEGYIKPNRHSGTRLVLPEVAGLSAPL